jgi:hypothetical protein
MLFLVIPARAGIQKMQLFIEALGTDFHRCDGLSGLSRLI